MAEGQVKPVKRSLKANEFVTEGKYQTIIYSLLLLLILNTAYI